MSIILNTAKGINWRIAFIVDGKDISDYITDFILPNLSFSPVNSGYGSRVGKIPAETVTISDITIEFLIDDQYEIYKTMADWAIANTNDPVYGSVTLELLDSYQGKVMGIEYTDVFPINISSINLSASQNETLNLSVSFEANDVLFS